MPRAESSQPLAVVAIGGNSITRQGQVGTIPEQYANARDTSRHVAQMIEMGWRVVLTHGNGPQIGSILLRVEMALPHVYPLTLDICDSDSQGGMGYMLQQVLGNELRTRGIRRTVATVVTQVVVSRDDPAFKNPTKPVGRFYTAEEAAAKSRETGWTMAEDAGRGWRRVVPSPKPLSIVEIDAIRDLVQAGTITVAAGGGGIPVVREGVELSGVEAVVDKDRTSALLAIGLPADLFLISTGVDRVALDHGKPTARPIDRMTVEEARRHLAEGQFPPGSMGPKIEAACDFIEAGGREVIITLPEKIPEALENRAGTHITASPADRKEKRS
ncbi:MAG: carbamate kinase [Planctomycetes bacterium]|nr:carbamate kinase [Planctomycetota bacterium]